MAYYRAQLAFPRDSALPRDVITINPHFSGDSPQALADALKANLMAATFIGAQPFTVKIYDDEKAPPSYPLAIAEQTGTVPSTNTPRETAICLSYYATWNRKSFRGRLYLPSWWVGGTIGLRPTAGQITSALAFRTVLTAGIPGNHRWGVWSKLHKTFAGTTHCWVDDEWDTIRSRGLRGTTRQTATV